MLDGLGGDVGHLRSGLVRLAQRFPGDLLRGVGGLLRRLAHLAHRLRDVVLEAGQLAFDALERRLRRIARAQLDLLERVVDLLPDLLGRFDRLLRALGRLARRLERPGGRVLDLVGDLLRLLGRVLQRLGELAQVLDGGRALLDGVTLGPQLGGVAGVDEEKVVGGDDVVLAVDALARLVDLDHAAGLDGRIAGDARLGVHEDAGAPVVLALGHRLEQVLLPAGHRDHRLDFAEHFLDQLGAGLGAAHLAELVALLAGPGHLLHLVGVPAGGRDLRHLVEGVHLLDEAADVLSPSQLGGGAVADLGLLEEELSVGHVHAEAGDGGPLHEEVVVREVVLDDVVMHDLAVVDVGGEAVLLGDLAGQVAVLHVLVGLGGGALVEGVALVDAGDDQAGRAVGREHDLEVRDFALAHALQLAAPVAELDLDGGAGLELVLLGPVAVDVAEVDPEAARLVHVVRDADADHGPR